MTNTPPPTVSTSTDDSGLTVNTGRWMTDISAQIDHLRLHQLAIPGAHNSGVDEDGHFDVGKPWAVCQYNNFARQLAAGARYLDLRLVDSSYKKTIGNKYPTYKFIEIFEFKHGIVSVGRRLEHLVEAVRSFAVANPGEFIIMDFHSYDRGRNYSHTSFKRCLPKFSSLQDMLIPPLASNLSIGDLRKEYPGRNVILCMSYDAGEAAAWPSGTVTQEQLWSPLQHLWNSTDASEEGITSLVTDMMKHPPLAQYSVLSAAVTENNKPKDLPPTSPVRTEAFKPGFQNVKILMIDFINSENARTSVVNKCVELNKLRAADKSPPTAPSNLVVIALDEAVIDGKFQNTLRFTWTPAVDNTAVRYYAIYANGQHFASTSRMPYERKNFTLKNYEFQVKAIDTTDNESEWSNTFVLIQDVIPPTIPENFIFLSLTPDSAYIEWDHAIDAAGVRGYEVYLADVFLEFVNSGTVKPAVHISSLNPDDSYALKVRAVDINDLYSEYGSITIPPRHYLLNPRVSIKEYDEQTKRYDANIIWETSIAPDLTTFYNVMTADFPSNHILEPGQIPSFAFQASQGEHIVHQCHMFFTHFLTGARTFDYEFTFDATPPEPVSNLKITSKTVDATSISWSPSTSGNVVNYAISVNEEAPTLIPNTVNTYTFEKLPSDQKFLIEVWAINVFDVPSVYESLVIDTAPPEKPGTPTVGHLTDKSATLTWTASEGLNVRYRISLNGVVIAQTDQLEFTITHLRSHRDYQAEIRAFNELGVSEPSSVTFKTRLSAPVNLRFSHQNGRCRLAWNPIFGQLPSHEVSINGKIFTTDPGRYGYSFNLSDLSPGPAPHHFTFKVRARLDGASSEESVLEKSLTDGVPPTKPGTPVVSDITDTSATLTWERSSDNVGVTGYQVVLNAFLVFNTPDTRFTLTNLVSGAFHFVNVRAVDKDGNASAISDRTIFTTTGQAPLPPPPAPVVSITEETTDSLRFEWGAFEGGTSGVRISINDEHWRDVFLLPRVNVPNLATDVEYTFSFSKFDIYGQLSEPTLLKHELKDTTPPTPPTHLKSTITDTTTLSWDASTDDIRVCEYVIYNNREYFDTTPLTQYVAIGLMSGTHFFEVVALDDSGNASTASSITVDIKDPASPDNFRYRYAALRHILEWDPPVDGQEVREYKIVLTGPGGNEISYKTVSPTLNPLMHRNTRYAVSVTAITAAGESQPLISEMTTG